MGRAFEYADGVGGRRRAAVIRAATGDDVIIGEQELRHAMRHFTLPRDLVLSLITRMRANRASTGCSTVSRTGVTCSRSSSSRRPAHSSQACTPRDAAFGRRTAGSGRCCHEEVTNLVPSLLRLRTPVDLLARWPLR